MTQANDQRLHPMVKRSLILLAALLLAPLAVLQGAETVLYVSPGGRDSWSGTAAQPNRDATYGPLATLAGARDAVRELKRTQQGDIHVRIRGGWYPLAETVVFGLQDSGKPGQVIHYEAAPGEQPVFSSGVRLGGWQPAGDRETLPGAAQGKVWMTSLPEGIGLFKTLYHGETMLPRARGKGFVPVIDAFGRDQQPHLRSRTVMYYPADAPIRNWENVDDVEIVIRPWALWVMNILPVATVNEASRTLTTAIPGTYFLTRERYHRLNKEAVWVENTLDGMTQPGNWCVNTRTRKIYYWPASGQPGDNLFIPRLKEYIRVEGEIDLEGPSDIPVTHLAFRGLTFIHGERDVWTPADTGCQHDWEIQDKDNAYLRLRGAEDCLVEHCEFRNGGGTGIRLDLHAQRNIVRNNHLHHLGGSGIFLGGYGPGTKDVNKQNRILNNHIHHIGRLYWMNAGILLTQSGENHIAHNLIHDTPYNGMAICGYRPYFFHNAFRDACARGTLDGMDYSWAHFWSNTEAVGLREVRGIRWPDIGPLHDFKIERFETGFSEIFNLVQPFIHSRMNVIEYNEIHDAMQVLGDGNGIYLSDTGPANVIRYNHLHHIRNTAIRTDAHQRDTAIHGNIVAYCGGGIACYNNNQAWHNIIAFPQDGQDMDGTPKAGGAYYTTDHGGFSDGVIQRNIAYLEGDCRPTFNAYMNDTNKQMQVDYNLVYFADDPAKGERLLEECRHKGVERHSLSADPLFVDVRRGDYRLHPDSPAIHKLGFPQLDVTRMGLLKQDGVGSRRAAQETEQRQP